MNRLKTKPCEQVKVNLPLLRHQSFSLSHRLRYGVASLVVSSLLLTGGLLSFLSYQTQVQQSKLLQQERSRAAASEINAYLNDLQHKLAYLSKVRGLTNLSPEEQHNLLEALAQHNDAYEIVGILNKSGEVVAAMSPYGQVLPYGEVLLDDPAHSPMFWQTFNQKKDYISTVETNPATNMPVVAFAVPILNRQNKVDGVLFARINLKFLWDVISKTHVGETGYTYVIDSRNFLIATKDSTPDTFKLQNLSDRPFIRNLLSINSQKFTVYPGLNGEKVLGAVALVKNVQWKVVVELPAAEAYAPVRYMLIVMGGALSLVGAIAVGLGFFLSQQVVLPLQHLTAAAARISSGNLDAQVDIPSSNELGLLATTFNQMTEQLRELVEQLEKERNFVSAILDIAGALVVVLDAQGRIIRFNRACEQATHYLLAEVQLRYFWEMFIVPEEIEAVKTVFEKLRMDYFPLQHENYCVTKNGERRLIAWSNTAIVDDEGWVKNIISVGVDITERKQVEEVTKQAKETAEKALQDLQRAQLQLIQAEKMSSLGQLVAGVAHEINNPVNFIYGNLTYMEEYTDKLLQHLSLYQRHYPNANLEIKVQAEENEIDFLSEDLPKILASMKMGAERISQIVLSLRNFSRLDESEMKEVDIHEGIDNTLLILQSRLKAKSNHPCIEVIKNYGNLPLVDCYAGQLNQVFMNILANAIDALEIFNAQQPLDAINSSPSRIIISTEMSKYDHVIVRIADNGPGISEKVKSQLFNPFFTTKPVGQGTGLGLSISYQIIDKHEGSIRCISELGQGAEFWIELPVKQLAREAS